jgi:hypothetical protein
MNGMHQEQHWGYTVDSDEQTHSDDYKLPPTPTLAQITVGDFYEFDDKSHANLGFTSCTYLDQNGVPQTDTFPGIHEGGTVHVFGRNGLTSATFSGWRVQHFRVLCGQLFLLGSRSRPHRIDLKTGEFVAVEIKRRNDLQQTRVRS